MEVRKLEIASATAWSAVSDGIAVSDEIDRARAPDAKMTVGFARLDAGEELPISFPYDEVLVITRGTYVVETEAGEQLRASAGDVVYLPAGSSNGSRAIEETEMVYIANPPETYAEHVAAAAAATEG